MVSTNYRALFSQPQHLEVYTHRVRMILAPVKQITQQIQMILLCEIDFLQKLRKPPVVIMNIRDNIMHSASPLFLSTSDTLQYFFILVSLLPVLLFFLIRTVKFFSRLQADCSQPPVWKTGSAVDGDVMICPINISRIFIFIDCLCRGMTRHQVRIIKIFSSVIRPVPDKIP